MQSSLAFSTQLTNRPRLRLPAKNPKREHIKIWTEDLEKNKLHQVETNLGMRGINSGQMGAKESLVSHTMDLSLKIPILLQS